MLNADEFAGRAVLITGAGRGIGLAIARTFLVHSANVVVHARSGVESDEISTAVNSGRAFVVSGDLERATDRTELFRRAADRFGALSVLVNNAGVQDFATIANGDDSAFEHMLRVNVVAAVDCMRRAAQAMQGHQGDRCIINIVSVRGSRPGAGAALYAASKSSLLSATRSAAIEFGPLGVRVNAVSPGLVWRNGLEEAWPDGVRNYREIAPLRRIGQPDDIADACLMLASRAAGWITGVDLIVDGGMSLLR